MTDRELRKRVQRFFFAMDRFLEPDHSTYWLEEMRRNRKLVEDLFDKEDKEEQDNLQLKLFK